MHEKLLTISEIYAKGIANLKARGVEWTRAGGGLSPSIVANRKYLDSLFFVTKYFDPVTADTGLNLFGAKLKTPVFCSALSRTPYMDEKALPEIARGIAEAGSFMMLGIGGSQELQAAIETGAPVVKIIKPYRNTDLIFEKLLDAETRGCFAVGMDIDHFYGVQRINGEIQRTETFGPQKTEIIKQMVSQTKLPFIIKGVLSLADAGKALELGASGIVVSNHGGGSLSFSLPSLYALPEIVAQFGKRMTVLVDSGFETGNDVMKGLALGAKGVGFGSSMTLAWAADGAAGVTMLVNQLTAELKRTMAATGCADLDSIDQSVIVPVRT